MTSRAEVTTRYARAYVRAVESRDVVYVGPDLSVAS